MLRKAFSLLLLSAVPAVLSAQQQDVSSGRCSTPDSIAVRGNRRVDVGNVVATTALVPGTQLNYRILQRAIRDLYETGNFETINITCEVSAADKALLTFTVVERPILEAVQVRGVNRLGERTIRDLAELPQARPLDPAAVSRAIFKIDSTYEKAGYYLARVRAESTVVSEGNVGLTFIVEEGRRLALSGLKVNGNTHVPAEDIAGAMKTKPEGFWFFRAGEISDDEYAADLAERIPALYARRGFIDFRIAQDTLHIDRERGKALLELTVVEGPQYKVGEFEVVGGRHYSDEEIRAYYPFENVGRPLTSRVTGFLLRKTPVPTDVFNQAAWEDATGQVRQAYANDGYIYSEVAPVVERRVTPDSIHYVDLRWEVNEGAPAVINRIEIIGNDYTTETCIRDQLVILPGDVYNQQRLIQSWQSIGNLGFFETPLPPPDQQRVNEQGDINLIFRVKERRTGNVNFGASMGQGTGFGGFIGLDQPNLFGLCKRGALQWQFGRYFNDFNLTYSDPRIRQSMVSGSVTVYRTMARYYIADLGRSLRTGGQVQVGFPTPFDLWTRLFLSYAGEGVKFGSSGLLGETQALYGNNSFRSSLGVTVTRDTRVGTPFPTGGGSQSMSVTFTGGPLGGTSSFQRYTTETSAYVPIAQIGGTKPGQQPMIAVAGLSTRGGAVLGSTGPFFFSQEFALGGVQYGERLRGYEEFSITPDGYLIGTSTYNAQRSSFGKAFFATTAEVGLRMNQSLYVNTFFEAGNVWRRAREIDPTRLFRSLGVGASIITPFGPLGLDYAYGIDRLDLTGRRAPKWQLHFRFGQIF
ncbi:MAG TPA: outer membrane protein assembly factor BamA [Gemmatimonadaceae bacterium]|nr:outer membrane protein assembly factor BamA [Gemmatimonadaceae bacterium]